MGYFDNVERLSFLEVASLPAAIVPNSKKFKAAQLAHPNLRWIETSNLQKAIRRGDIAQAVGSANGLHALEPIKFFRRLCVIALEDVSLGDLKLVAAVIGYAAAHRKPDAKSHTERAECLALVEAMARSIKDRAACELATAAMDPPDRLPDVVRSGQLSPRDAGRLYAARDSDLRDRCLAGAALAGTLSLGGKRIGTRDHATLSAALARMDLPDAINCIALTSLQFGGEVAALAMNVPLVYHAMRSERVVIRRNVLPKAEVIRGLLSPSFDAHTRTGLRALGSYVAACSDLHRLCSEGGLNPRRTVRMIAFRSEGSALDRELCSPLGERLSRMNEQATCAANGYPYEALAEAKRTFLSSLPILNDLRRRYADSEARALGIA